MTFANTLCGQIDSIKGTARFMTMHSISEQLGVAAPLAEAASVWNHSGPSALSQEDAHRVTENQGTGILSRKLSTESLKETEKRLREENVLLRSSLRERYRFGSIIGKSPAIQRVYELIVNAASNDANVILYGESGTGKELVAHAIHEMSSRKSGSFVPVNCGAIPETLMESEFFGHRKGAFTGAVMDKHGFLDLADGGTLFLDELGEIGQSMQVKLLRAIDGGGFTPIGGSQVKTPDLRIIAATNRDVAEQVRKGVIREDFFYRIHVIPIQLPALRERKEDIPLLVEHFVEKFGKGKNLPPLTPRIMEALRAHDWPGNVRELQNTVFRFLTLKKLDFAGTVRRFGAGTQNLPLPEAETGNLEVMLEDFEKQVIKKTLDRHHWQREVTADALGIHRKTLFTKMKKFGLI
jgi:transcriptional regulator with PAS, ATPase and Fis domain